MIPLVTELFALLLRFVDDEVTRAKLVEAEAAWNAYASVRAAADLAAAAKFGPRQ